MEEQKTAEQLRQDNLDRIARYRPLDDDFMRELFRNNIPLSELVLRIITGKYDLKITSQETQYDMKRLAGARSICLDVLATDDNGEKYNIEIQRSDACAYAKRARYHSSSLDIEYLNAGDDFSLLPITYVIFITENDVRGEGRPVYDFERRDTGNGKPLNDGAHIIYVNGAYNNEADNSDIAKLMHDFRCSKAEDMQIGLLAERTKYFKETPEGVSYMCKLNEDMCNEAAKAARYEQAVETAVKLIKKGLMTLEDIAECSNLSLDEVKALAEKHKPATA